MASEVLQANQLQSNKYVSFNLSQRSFISSVDNSVSLLDSSTVNTYWEMEAK